MSKLSKEFISEENRHYGFKIGRHVASGLSGFIAGAIFATLVLGAVILILLNS